MVLFYKEGFELSVEDYLGFLFFSRLLLLFKTFGLVLLLYPLLLFVRFFEAGRVSPFFFLPCLLLEEGFVMLVMS